MPFFKQNDVFDGRYLLAELLGEGGFSEVWAAKDQLVGDETVVLKMYAPGKGLEEQGIQQYRQEFYLSQNIAHPHLLKISHFDVSEGIAFLVMPFYSKGNLGRLQGEVTFNERQIALIMSQIASALAALHRQDPPVLHQHVRPDNIVISEPDYYLLANFGISSLPIQTLPKATAGQEPVTTAFTPPETFDRFLKTGQSGDIFSLGVTLFALCTKIIPWNGGGGQSLLKERYIGQLPKPYSSELDELLQACMSINNFKRPTAEELHLRARNFLETGHWNLPEEENEEVSPFRKVKPYFLAAAISLLFITGASVAYFYNNPAVAIEKQQQMGVSVNTDNHSNEDKRQVAMLENEVVNLEKRNLELEEENIRLLYKDSVSTVLLANQGHSEGNQAKSTQGLQAKAMKNEIAKRAVMASAPTVKEMKKDNFAYIQKELEQQLNKISDPALPVKDRTALKKEALTHFSEGAVRILDETAGASRQFSAGIFLNLLFNVPHTIKVKEVKRDQYRKITELRLSMQTKK